MSDEKTRSGSFGPAKPKGQGKMSATTAGLISAAAIAAGAYFYADAQQQAKQEDLGTSSVEDFQNGGASSGRVTVPDARAENDPIVIAERAASEALQTPSQIAPEPQPLVVTARQDEATRKEIAELRKALVKNTEERDAALRSAIDELKSSYATEREATVAEVERLKAESRELSTKLNSAVTQAASERSRADALALQLQQSGERQLMLKQEEQARRDADALRRAQVTSPPVLYSAGGSVARSGAASGNGGGADYEATQDEAFLNRAPALKVDTASQMIDPERTLAQGSVVQAVLQTAINSDLPGNVVAVVSEPVQSFAGDSVLVPRGSRLFGSYKSDINTHQKRILIAWNRILTPDGISMQISAVGGDSLGRSGLTGFVDARFDERFGGAALISLIGAGPALAAQSVRNETASDALVSVAEDLQDASSTVMAEQLSIAPTIYVDQGASVTVIVDRDVVIY